MFGVWRVGGFSCVTGWVWVESMSDFHVGFADGGYFVESAHSCNSGSVVV